MKGELFAFNYWCFLKHLPFGLHSMYAWQSSGTGSNGSPGLHSPGVPVLPTSIRKYLSCRRFRVASFYPDSAFFVKYMWGGGAHKFCKKKKVGGNCTPPPHPGYGLYLGKCDLWMEDWKRGWRYAINI